MKPFLENIAQYYLDNYELRNLHKFCFIFPNRRSGVFFRKYLQDLSNEVLLLPEIITISDWINELTHGNEIGKIQQLFILYSTYRKLLNKYESSEIPSFEDFVFWGDTILNDFNDCDKYLANPESLFSNLKDIKSINTDYLSKEQKEVIQDFFGIDYQPEKGEDNFWININQSENASKNLERFIHFWELLLPLYQQFNEALSKENICYSGMNYRKAVTILNDKANFEYDKYIFIGFNMLSTSEYKIFDILKKKGIADFFWDFNSPMIKDPQNKASKFISKYIEHFKSPIKEEENNFHPAIEVISVPSNISQIRYVESLIERVGHDSPNTDFIKTAIVLPDENMLMPMISFIPDNIDKVNITMGFPFKNSSLASFLKLLSTLHLKATTSDAKRKYFYEDIKSILLHPFIKNIEGVNECITLLENKRLYFVDSTIFQEYILLKDIFSMNLELSDPNKIIDYLDNLFSYIENLLEKDKKSNKLDLKFITEFKAILSQLKIYILDYEINLNEKSAFFLIERLLNVSTISFEGEPLEGLQIMGILESRCLDFDNIILMSMNEKTFPKKHFAKTFIPISLRSGFGLSTLEYQESIFAYYFYRLISRAKNVFLTYDSRTQGVSSGEPSRYIYQLKYLYDKNNLHFITGQFKISTTNKKNISIHKDDLIMDKINLYKTLGSETYLSASSINTYIDCPLKFYFNHIENIKGDIIADDYIDNATFGTIVHNVLSKSYLPYTNKVISKNDFKNIRTSLDQIITRAINKDYFHKIDTALDEPLIGEGLLIGNTVRYIVDRALTYDQQYNYFEFLQSEKKEYCHWKINNDFSINIKQYIDRVDKVNDVLRIVDYKTGQDKIIFKDIEDLFLPKKERPKAILQLLIYCNVYHQLHPDLSNEIQPLIYKLREIRNNDNIAIKFGKEELLNYNDVNKEFCDKLEMVLSSLFNKEVPFTQTTNQDLCEYCEFAQICH